MHDVTEQRKNEEMRREFVANVSHELRTPLTNIRSYAETLADSAGQLAPATEKKFLGVILNESDRMTHIVQDLLTLSRLDSGRDELKLARFSFGQAVQDLYNAVYMEAQRHGHALTLYHARRPAPGGGRPGAHRSSDDERGVQRHQIHARRRQNRHLRRPDGQAGVDAGGRTTASASPPRTATGSSSASTGWTRPVPASPAAPAWACPSPRSWWTGTGAGWSWWTRRAPAWPCG